MNTINCDALNFIAPAAYQLEGRKFSLELRWSEACLLHEVLDLASHLPGASEDAILATSSLAQYVKVAAQVAEGFDPDDWQDETED